MARVVRFHELGGPEVLRLEEITFEDPALGELRLKVGAIGLNRLEVVYRSGGLERPTNTQQRWVPNAQERLRRLARA